MTTVATAFPDTKVEAAFGYGPFDTAIPAGAWIDISNWVTRIRTQRGDQHQLDEIRPGTATLSLLNHDGRFSPWNSAGPYYGGGRGLDPGTPIRVTAPWPATLFPVWYGYVDRWSQKWESDVRTTVEVSCTDAFGVFGAMNVDSDYYLNWLLGQTPVVYYRLGDATSAASAVDSSGHGRNAGIVGLPVFGVPGAVVTDSDTAVDVTTGYLTVPYEGTLTGSGPLTVEAWVRGTLPASYGPAGHLWAIYLQRSRNLAASNHEHVLLAVDPLNGTLEWRVGDDGGATTQFGGPNILDGHWHHIAGTWLPTLAGGMDLYVDGVSVAHYGGAATLPAPAAVANDDNMIGVGYDTVYANAMTIEQLAITVGATAPAGSFELDEVATYATQLTANDILTHYLLGRLMAHPSGSRINWVLDLLSWATAARSIDAGVSIIDQPGIDDTLTGTTLLRHILDVARSEDGLAYMGADGRVVFHARARRFASPGRLSRCTLGNNEAGGELPFIVTSSAAGRDTDLLYNQVVASRRGGASVTVADQPSIARYGRRVLTLDLLLAAGEVNDRANWTLGHNKIPLDRIPKVTLTGHSNPALIYPQILGRDLGDRVTAVRRFPVGAPLNLLCSIQSIEHDIDCSERVWTTSWGLDPVDTAPVWTLEDPVLGIIDSVNVIAY